MIGSGAAPADMIERYKNDVSGAATSGASWEEVAPGVL